MKHYYTKILVASLSCILILLHTSAAHAVVTEFDDIALDGQGTNPFIRWETTGQPDFFTVRFNNRFSFWNGNAYTFNIFSGAPSGLLNVNTNGVGIGIQEPMVPLHLLKSDGKAQIRVVEAQSTTAVKTLFNLICEECTPGFRFNQVMPSNQTWFFRMLQNGNFSVDDPLTSVKEAEFQSGGNLVIGGILTQSSSTTAKKNIIAVNNTAILDKLDALPVSLWTYNHEKDEVRHMGPMAEDFFKAFKLGATAKGIASLDSSGVALAAIKGLNQRLKEKTSRLEALEANLELKDAETRKLSARLDAFAQTLTEVSATNALLVELIKLRGNNVVNTAY